MSEIANGKASMAADATVERGGGQHHAARIAHTYEVECIGPDGEVKWRDVIHNLVTTAGLNKYLDATLKTGLTTPAWYVGLVTGPSETGYNAADTMGSHAGWAEDATYSNANRPTFTPGTIAAGSVSNASSVAAFTINGTATISGAFLADENTKSGTTGTLLGVGAFSGGDKAVANNDTLNVTVTATITAA
jgi:hypothetical protein